MQVTVLVESVAYWMSSCICQGISDLRQTMQFINAFNAPLSWLRVIKYLEALSPTTRQV